MPAKLILFAKSPVPGLVKTRLLTVLTPDLAADLHSAFVLDMVQRLRHVNAADFELHTDTCSDAWKSLGVTRKVQISGDLGLKMVHALQEGLKAEQSASSSSAAMRPRSRSPMSFGAAGEPRRRHPRARFGRRLLRHLGAADTSSDVRRCRLEPR